jgi:hypothetical protein
MPVQELKLAAVGSEMVLRSVMAVMVFKLVCWQNELWLIEEEH